MVSTLNVKKQEETPLPKNHVNCIIKLQQYSDNVYSKKIKKEKTHSRFFTENKEVSIEIERKSAVIENVIAYLEGDTEKTFNQDEISSINTGLTGKFISENGIMLPESQAISGLAVSS